MAKPGELKRGDIVTFQGNPEIVGIILGYTNPLKIVAKGNWLSAPPNGRHRALWCRHEHKDADFYRCVEDFDKIGGGCRMRAKPMFRRGDILVIRENTRRPEIVGSTFIVLKQGSEIGGKRSITLLPMGYLPEDLRKYETFSLAEEHYKFMEKVGRVKP